MSAKNKKPAIDRKTFTREIGTYLCGLDNIRVIFDPEFGGSFVFAPESGSISEIRVGHGQGTKTWKGVVGYLLHEAMEFAMTRMGARHSQNPDYAHTSSSYLFVMDHEKFAASGNMASWLMASCFDDLRAAFDELAVAVEAEEDKRREADRETPPSQRK